MTSPGLTFIAIITCLHSSLLFGTIFCITICQFPWNRKWYPNSERDFRAAHLALRTELLPLLGFNIRVLISPGIYAPEPAATGGISRQESLLV
jgi:hypothetical protein